MRFDAPSRQCSGGSLSHLSPGDPGWQVDRHLKNSQQLAGRYGRGGRVGRDVAVGALSRLASYGAIRHAGAAACEFWLAACPTTRSAPHLGWKIPVIGANANWTTVTLGSTAIGGFRQWNTSHRCSISIRRYAGWLEE